MKNEANDGLGFGPLLPEKTREDFRPIKRPLLTCPCGQKFEFAFEDYGRFDHSFVCPGCGNGYTFRGVDRSDRKAKG